VARARRAPRRLVLLLTLSLAAFGCRQAGLPGAWERLDLAAAEPRVEVTPFGPEGPSPYRSLVAYLGAAEVRDLSRVPPNTFAVYPHQSAGQVQALEQAAASRLAWRLTLGSEPHFSATPLLDDQAPCPCTFRMGVRAGGEVTELYRFTPERPPPPAPAAVEADLSRWAGQEVEVLLEVDGPAGGEARWGSPEVWSRRPAPAPPAASHPNVLLIGVDTLRADHVGAFRRGDEPPWQGPTLTPAIDRLAAGSDVWLDAYSTFNSTNPSFASILTGLYGKNHGVYDLKTALPAAHTTLAEAFHDAGYATLAVISASHLGDHNSGLAQGFDRMVEPTEHSAAERAVETVTDWIATDRRPFFVWLHLFDPHTPHTPPEPYASGFRPAVPSGLGPVGSWVPFRSPGPVVYEQPILAGHRDLYAGEIAYADHQLDRLLDFLASRGLLADTVVALVADHGENLGDHGFLDRHVGLWETTTHVPLLIRWPGEARPGRRLAGLVQTIDLFPTLLDAAGLAAPESDGSDLRRLTGEGRSGRPAAFSEHSNHLGARVRIAAHSLMRSRGIPEIPDGTHLFALGPDPGEEHDLAGRGLEVETQLSRVLHRWLGDRRPSPAAPSRELTPEEAERLRSLGYL
jgi:arylsulfatase A-like enzyme